MHNAPPDYLDPGMLTMLVNRETRRWKAGIGKRAEWDGDKALHALVLVSDRRSATWTEAIDGLPSAVRDATRTNILT